MKTNVGLLIREKRQQKLLTQKELSVKLGVSAVFVGKVETGHSLLPIKRFKSVCKVLGIDHQHMINIMTVDYTNRLQTSRR